MTIYPSLLSGSVCQYPITKAFSFRTISNSAEDESRITLQDPNATNIRWTLQYAGISDSELATLRTFFEASEGRLNTFTFADPTANLLVWSEDLQNAAWQKSSLLTIQTGVADPWGTQRASRLTNATQGVLSLVQTIPIPPTLMCCWSLYARSSSGTVVALTRDSDSGSFTTADNWSRLIKTGSRTGDAAFSNFGVTIPPGGAVEVFGLQVMAQPAPSQYVSTLNRSGLYPGTRFDSDALIATSNGPNDNSCPVTLYSRTT